MTLLNLMLLLHVGGAIVWVGGVVTTMALAAWRARGLARRPWASRRARTRWGRRCSDRAR